MLLLLLLSLLLLFCQCTHATYGDRPCFYTIEHALHSLVYFFSTELKDGAIFGRNAPGDDENARGETCGGSNGNAEENTETFMRDVATVETQVYDGEKRVLATTNIHRRNYACAIAKSCMCDSKILCVRADIITAE